MKENTIEFKSTDTWVMRITADRRIEVNEDVEVTEAAKLVLAALQPLLALQEAAPRQWVGLTEDEMNEIYKVVRPSVFEFWKRCEAKLKEKNT